MLLKNSGILPLPANTSVALVGDFARKPRYQGAGSSIVNPTKLECVMDDTRNFPFNVIGYADGFERYGKHKTVHIDRAVELGKKADVTLFFAGLDEYTEAEGLDRQSLCVPENQIKTYKALKAAGLKVVVVLSCGSAVYMDWAADADGNVRELQLIFFGRESDGEGWLEIEARGGSGVRYRTCDESDVPSVARTALE